MNLDFYYGFNSKESKSTVVYSHSKVFESYINLVINKKTKFFFKLIRKQDIEKKKKRNKIEWMKKMYNYGMLKPKTDDKESNIIVDETAQNIIHAYDNNKIDMIDDWEVDQLLDWTNGLSYNE